MQLAWGAPTIMTSEFQSSSGPWAGCNLPLYAFLVRVGIGRFNPHPAQGPDATPTLKVLEMASVSILIRPLGRMQPHREVNRMVILVSILIRPKGRMQQGSDYQTGDVYLVSILIRPKGRMQLRVHLRVASSR